MADQVSSMLQGSHTQVALPSVTTAASSNHFGSSAALIHLHNYHLLWPEGFVSSLQPTHTLVSKQATKGLGESLASLH